MSCHFFTWTSVSLALGLFINLNFLIFISSELESEVEMVRLDVVQKRCIANPAEVDSLNSQLSIISRQVSDLKGKFKLHYCHSSVP